MVHTSGMGVPLLIGTDVLETNAGVLDYSRNVLVLGNASNMSATMVVNRIN